MEINCREFIKLKFNNININSFLSKIVLIFLSENYERTSKQQRTIKDIIINYDIIEI